MFPIIILGIASYICGRIGRRRQLFAAWNSLLGRTEEGGHQSKLNTVDEQSYRVQCVWLWATSHGSLSEEATEIELEASNNSRSSVDTSNDSKVGEPEMAWPRGRFQAASEYVQDIFAEEAASLLVRHPSLLRSFVRHECGSMRGIAEAGPS